MLHWSYASIKTSGVETNATIVPVIYTLMIYAKKNLSHHGLIMSYDIFK